MNKILHTSPAEPYSGRYYVTYGTVDSTAITGDGEYDCLKATHHLKPQWYFDLSEDCPTCATDVLSINDRLFFTDGMTISHKASRSVPTVVGKNETQLYESSHKF